MNKRMNELAVQAEREVNEVFVWYPTGPDREDVIREKFAELLVQEFLFIIDDEREPEMVSRIKLWKQVKEQFGVEL